MARIELLAPVGAVAGNAVPLAKRRSHARGSSRRSPQQFEVRYPPVPGSRRGAAPERAQRVQDHPYDKKTAALPVPDEILEAAARECEVVINGIAD